MNIFTLVLLCAGLHALNAQETIRIKLFATYAIEAGSPTNRLLRVIAETEAPPRLMVTVPRGFSINRCPMRQCDLTLRPLSTNDIRIQLNGTNWTTTLLP